MTEKQEVKGRKEGKKERHGSGENYEIYYSVNIQSLFRINFQ